MSTPQHIAQNIQTIKAQLPAGCKLIVVSKYREVQEIEAAYASGQRLFAENRVQALLERKEALPNDIQWHLIGHLQTNKVKHITPFISMIHSVDSMKLLQEINKEATKNNRIIPCLVQLHIAQEETKFGLDASELDAFFAEYQQANLMNVSLSGLMAMASNTDDRRQIEAEFAQVQTLFTTIKETYFADQDQFCELSIGMSSDYDIAIAHGSTLVRVGSAVFT